MSSPSLPTRRIADFSLDGRIALVTGAGRGIGFSIARGFAEAGATVIINDVNPAAAQAASDVLCADGYKAEPQAFDVTDHPAGAAAIDAIVARHGKLDILMNNAGILIRKPVETHDMSDWDKVIAINLTSLYALAREATRHMRKAGYGRIINTASLMGISSRPGVISYVAAKHGVVGITRALAAELGAYGITVNAIGPGYIETEINKATLADGRFHKQVVDRTPLARWASPDELAGPAVFLASAAAGFVSGHVLMVDGGMSATLFQPEVTDLGLAA
ncbi:SDR family NAD(P)-dependent oxidoreductase [Bosea vaviloviae]|uniref:Gluconate 5-dehydrogenase n=1 Tax=Bosea vaviloviae TaxID=1526658 RepID=A0A1D7UCH0_9HYPH|nr:3-oxoacyl-ACP reductase FabG [Bosea vaviloviae]AOO85044.1 gluconate 5-dehydrogenase [Bosea vaviloviae]